ncbi:hypothetical protein Phum_PHUM523780 [Pediculus humanus corporis]|uniref:Cyclic nucleotide-binding domain-containing protein n=1 Tax=Pediculus humanus subsp. corporis TaxID=121224 RepID=E0VZ37_PEDHC|nr:uncharacterized protein Phum_PHUM523780 [Pediculus humanus corporis]EEB18643.1 hypothetical protein Phum_PHUM523780 [Pediculus humanus corporis]
MKLNKNLSGVFVCLKFFTPFGPNDRTDTDIKAIIDRLRRIESFSRLSNQVLQQLAACGFYEDLEKGVTHVGSTFGENILDEHPRHATVATQTTCELFRIKNQDFKLVWERKEKKQNGES